MRFKFPFCVLILATLLAAGPALAEEPRWGRLYTLSGNVPVRENPSDAAIQVRVLKAGQKVRVDFQDEGWAAVFDPKESVRSELRAQGYVKLSELRTRSTMELAQAAPAEAKRPKAEVKPEQKAETKPEAKPATKPEPKPEARPEAKAAKAKAPAAKEFGEVRVPDRQLTVRAKRDKDSEFVRALRPGQRVRVDFLEDGWFAVFHVDEKVRDLSRAWGFARDKYLVSEASFSGPLSDASAPATPPAAKPAEPAPKAQKGRVAAPEDEAVGYAVLERKDDHHKPASTVTMRVRLEFTHAPDPEVLRKVVREIWKAERRKNENLQLEVLLTGMDPHGLAYATARFHDDGRLREFWWRDVVLGKPKK